MATSTNPQTLIVNGIPVAELAALPELLQEAPEQGILSFQTRTRWLGGVRSRSEVTGFEAGGQRIERSHFIESDEPAQIFGTDVAPNPQELLLASIGACISATWAIKAAAMGIDLRSVEVELRGTLDLRGPLGLADVPRGYPEVSCRIFVDANATPEAIEALHQQTLESSPNFYHLTSAIPARTQLVIKG